MYQAIWDDAKTQLCSFNFWAASSPTSKILLRGGLYTVRAKFECHLSLHLKESTCGCGYTMYACRDFLCACLSAFLYPTNLIQMCIKLFFWCFPLHFSWQSNMGSTILGNLKIFIGKFAFQKQTSLASMIYFEV